MILVIKKNLFIFLFVVLICGCTRVDTNPNGCFQQIQKDVSRRTGQNVYWESMQDEFRDTIEKMLAKELTEESVVRIALLNNRDLQASYENLGIAKAQLAQAGLLKNPIFSLTYRFSTKSSVTDLIDIGLFQNFLEILLIPLKKKMAKCELEATKSMIITQILDVIAETKIAFYTLLAAQKIWDLKKQILLAAELSYEAAQKLLDVGNTRELDVSMQRSLYEQAKLEVASWEITVLQAREQLNVLMGLWGCQIQWQLSLDFPEIPEKEKDFKNIEKDAIACSLDLQIARKELLAIAAGLGIDTSKLVFPQVDVGISAEREESVWFVGPALNLALPFFDSGRVNSSKAQAKILQKWNQYTALAIDIRSKARLSRFFLLNAFRQSRYLKKIVVPLAEQITCYTLEQYNAMQLGVFRLLDTKQREIEQKIQAVQMQKEYWVSKIEMQTLLQGHVLGKNPFEMPFKKHYE